MVATDAEWSAVVGTEMPTEGSGRHMASPTGSWPPAVPRILWPIQGVALSLW